MATRAVLATVVAAVTNEDTDGEDADRGDAHRGDGDDVCQVEFSETQQWAEPGSLDTCTMTPKDVGSVRWRGVGFRMLAAPRTQKDMQ